MKKFLCAVLVVLFLLSCGAAFGAAAKKPAAKPANPAAKGRTEEMKRMSVFLSNFTETGLFNFRVGDDYGDEEATDLSSGEGFQTLIHFGIRHNYINNYNSRIKRCKDKDCEYGSLTLEGKFVADAVKRYFDLKLKNQSAMDMEPPLYYDGKLYHFEGADGEAVYYAEVKEVSKKGKTVTMTGDIYNAEDRKDRPGTFTAIAKPHKWNGKDTWAILSLQTDWNEEDD